MEKSHTHAILQEGNRVQDRLSAWWMLNAPACPAMTAPECQTGSQLHIPDMCNGRSGRLKESSPHWGTKSLDLYP